MELALGCWCWLLTIGRVFCAKLESLHKIIVDLFFRDVDSKKVEYLVTDSVLSIDESYEMAVSFVVFAGPVLLIEPNKIVYGPGTTVKSLEFFLSFVESIRELVDQSCLWRCQDHELDALFPIRVNMEHDKPFD